MGAYTCWQWVYVPRLMPIAENIEKELHIFTEKKKIYRNSTIKFWDLRKILAINIIDSPWILSSTKSGLSLLWRNMLSKILFGFSCLKVLPPPILSLPFFSPYFDLYRFFVSTFEYFILHFSFFISSKYLVCLVILSPSNEENILVFYGTIFNGYLSR